MKAKLPLSFNKEKFSKSSPILPLCYREHFLVFVSTIKALRLLTSYFQSLATVKANIHFLLVCISLSVAIFFSFVVHLDSITIAVVAFSYVRFVVAPIWRAIS